MEVDDLSMWAPEGLSLSTGETLTTSNYPVPTLTTGRVPKDEDQVH